MPAKNRSSPNAKSRVDLSRARVSFHGPFTRLFELVFLAMVVTGSLFTSEKVFGASPPKSIVHCDIEFSKLSHGGKLTPRSELISTHLHMQFTSALENSKWMNRAKKSTPKSGVMFGDIEFSVLQKINTMTNDKNLATAITNKHKDLTFRALEKIQKKYGTNYDIELYSDFKSARFALVPHRKLSEPRAKLEEAMRADLAKMFDDVNEEFVGFIKKAGLEVDQNSADWFRGGLGVTADEANFAARTSRDMGGPNQLRDFENPEIQKNLATYQKWAEAMRQADLITDPTLSPLLDGAFVKADVLDIIKKNPVPSEARARLKAKYGADIDDVRIERLYTYNEIIDKFAPGIHVAERKVASLEKAEFGGLSADFSGLGAQNRDATARALAEGKDLREAIALSRRNEQQVTDQFKASTAAFKKIMDRYLTGTISSGDDFVGNAPAVLSNEIKKKLVVEVAGLPTPSAQRLSFIGAGVNSAERNLVAAHGEAIEKILRQELEGRVSMTKLREVVFGVDMRGLSAGQGDVALFTGEGSRAALTPTERQEIQAAFERAIEAFNKKPERELLSKHYVAK